MADNDRYLTWHRLSKQAIGDNSDRKRKVIASWFVHPMPGQSSRRADNSLVPLGSSEVGQVFVDLPPALRDKVVFTLMHDKKRARDQPRAGPLKHAYEVDGGAHDWPRFGKRIYIGRLMYPGGQSELWKHVAGFRVTLEV